MSHSLTVSHSTLTISRSPTTLSTNKHNKKDLWLILRKNVHRIPALARVDANGNKRESVWSQSDDGATEPTKSNQSKPSGRGEVEEDYEVRFLNESYLQSAIPFLPRGVAVLFLMINVMIPGLGTMLSGLSVVCCGRPRIQTKESRVSMTICINVFVGLMQLFTITFFLVGWIWSLVWGVYMVVLAVEKDKQALERRKMKLQANALMAINDRLRLWNV